MTPPHGTSETMSSEAVVKAVVITDLVDSTGLVDRLGDHRAYHVGGLHDQLARGLLARHHGREIDKSDGFLMLFDRPVDAVRFALAYHRALDALSRQEEVELKARVGIHLGEVFLRHNAAEDVKRGAKPVEVEGLAKPTAARLMALALGGQTLVTRGVYELTRRALVGAPNEVDGEALSWCEHGAYAFQGVAEPLAVFEVGVSGLAPLAPPPDSVKAWRVDGPGGEGKRGLLGRPWLLAGMIVAALALAVLGLWVTRQVSAEQRQSVAVLGFKNLSGRDEHAWLATALSEILATELSAGESLRLIPAETVARARRELAVAGGETLGRDTLEQIRANLGTDFVVVGSYLATGEAVDPLLVRLQDTRRGETVLSVRKRGREDALYELVADAGAELRRALGVGATTSDEQQAARATLSENAEAARRYSEGLAALRNLEALAAREHLEAAAEADPEFALAHAALSEAWHALGHDRLAEESARRAFELAQGLPREAYLSIEGGYYEVAGEWGKAIETYRVLWGYHPDDIEHGLRLAAAETAAGRGSEALATVSSLRRLPPPLGEDPRVDLAEAQVHWSLSDYPRMIEATERAARKGRAQGTPALVAEALAEQARAEIRYGRPARARAGLEEARRLFDKLGDQGKLAGVLNELAILENYQGDLAAAEKLYGEALDIQREIGNRQWVSRLLNNLAVLTRNQGQLAAAREMLEQAVEIAREVANASREGVALENLSTVLLRQGEIAAAEQTARQALELYQGIGEQSGAAWTWQDLGQIAFAAGRTEEARQGLERSLELGRAIGYKHQVASTLLALAEVSLAAGRRDEAKAQLDEAWRLRGELGEKLNLAEVELARGELALASGRAGDAEALARRAAAAFAAADIDDDLVAATDLRARALLAAGKAAAAHRVLAEVERLARRSESPRTRLAFEITSARLQAAESPAAALARLEAAVREAEERRLVPLGLEASLAAGQVELATDPAAGRTRLEALARRARQQGLAPLAERAEKSLARAAA